MILTKGYLINRLLWYILNPWFFSEYLWNQQHCDIDIYNATWKFQGENYVIQIANENELSKTANMAYALFMYLYSYHRHACTYRPTFIKTNVPWVNNLQKNICTVLVTTPRILLGTGFPVSPKQHKSLSGGCLVIGLNGIYLMIFNSKKLIVRGQYPQI